MMLSVRLAEKKDLPDIIEVHCQSFKGFFLTLLGAKFLNEFYGYFIANDLGALWIAESDETVVGFAAFTVNPEVFFKQFKRQKALKLLTFMVPALVKHPLTVLRKIARAVVYRGDKNSTVNNSALLSSIGVLPEASGKSVGSELLKKVEFEVRSYGVTSIYLTTDAYDNEPTLYFYKKNLYEKHSTFTQNGGRMMYRLSKDLSKEIINE